MAPPPPGTERPSWGAAPLLSLRHETPPRLPAAGGPTSDAELAPARPPHPSFSRVPRPRATKAFSVPSQTRLFTPGLVSGPPWGCASLPTAVAPQRMLGNPLPTPHGHLGSLWIGPGTGARLTNDGQSMQREDICRDASQERHCDLC